jgi:hypothetical protein
VTPARNLVLARVGRDSLHPRWLDPGTPRGWDLRLVPYQEIPAQDECDCIVGDAVPGPKWSGIREALHAWDGWRDYDYVWIPDDDILATQQTITRMFEVARAVGLELFAPALSADSHYAHFITMENRRFHGRWVGFVEIMVPGFSARTLERLLPTLDLTATGWGWGLDSVWPKLLGYQDLGIIDSTPVLHTRPVGRMRDPELAERVLAESDAMLSSYDCRQTHVTFGGFGADLEPIDLRPEELLAEVVEGYRYLIERDPRLLSWIADFQRPGDGWPEYPVEGTPEAGRARGGRSTVMSQVGS